MEIIFLGTGCDYATPEREPASVLIKGPINILLDCPPSILKQLAKINMSPVEIDAVFISHRHAGHSLGLPFLLWGNIVLGRRRKILLFMPKDPVLSQLNELCSEGLYPGEVQYRKMFESELHLLEPTGPSSVNITKLLSSLSKEVRGDIFLHTAPMSHVEKEDLSTLGCSVEFQGFRTKIAYALDTQPCENTVELAREATLLVHDASFEHYAVEWARQSKHSTAKEAAEIAEKAKAEILALIHLHATRHNRSDIRDIFLGEAKQVFGRQVIFPNDLEILDLAAYQNCRPLYTVKKDYS